MKTVLVLSILLCAEFAAPAEEEATEVALRAQNEEMGAAPAYYECPQGWLKHNARCYMYNSTPVSWYFAKRNCNSLGAHLASVTNVWENKFLQQITGGTSIAWMGGFYLQGAWMWTDSKEFDYTNWYSSFLSFRMHPCLYIVSSGWGNEKCDAAHGFICSKNASICEHATPGASGWISQDISSI